MAGPKKTSRLMDLVTSFLAVLLLAVSGFGLHRRAGNGSATQPLSHLLAELTALSQRIASHALRLKIREVVTQARAVLNYLHTEPDKAGRWPEYVRDCLTSAVAGTEQFAQRSSHLTDPTDTTMINFGSFLTTITQTLSGVYTELIAGDTTHSESQIAVYQNTLSDINCVYRGTDKFP